MFVFFLLGRFMSPTLLLDGIFNHKLLPWFFLYLVFRQSSGITWRESWSFGAVLRAVSCRHQSWPLCNYYLLLTFLSKSRHFLFPVSLSPLLRSHWVLVSDLTCTFMDNLFWHLLPVQILNYHCISAIIQTCRGQLHCGTERSAACYHRKYHSSCLST